MYVWSYPTFLSADKRFARTRLAIQLIAGFKPSSFIVLMLYAVPSESYKESLFS